MTFWRKDYPEDFQTLRTMNMTENEFVSERDKAFGVGILFGGLLGFALGIGFAVYVIFS